MHHNELNDAQKREFAERFLTHWMANGFGVLTKSDTDLLVFDTLRRLLDPERAASNYDWSEYLRVSSSKVRNLRLTAHLRFQGGPEVLSIFLKRIRGVRMQVNPNGNVFGGCEVLLTIEDSAAQHELENLVKIHGGVVHHERNREVIRLTAMMFLAVVSDVEGFDEFEQVKALSEYRADDDKATETIKKMTEAVEYKRMTEGQKLAHAVEHVGKALVGDKPSKLIDYLKTVFNAQKATRKSRK